MCQALNCEGEIHARGLCFKHYMRLLRHGHIEATRPGERGAKHKHPLHESWQHFKKGRNVGRLCEEWTSDFWAFVDGIGGERPTPKSKLYAANDAHPIGPGNFVWKQAITQRVEGEDPETYKRRRARAYRSVNLEYYVEREADKFYLKRYGITKQQYLQMCEAQGNVCAICGELEQRTIRGKVPALSVDHCHTTGKIRGALCGKCNTGLASFKDDITLLEKAISYLNIASR